VLLFFPATPTCTLTVRWGRQSKVGTVMESWVAVAAVTVAGMPPMVTVLRDGVELKSVPRRMTVEPSTRVSGDTEVRTGIGVTVGAVGDPGPESPPEQATNPITPPSAVRRNLMIRTYPPRLKWGQSSDGSRSVSLGQKAEYKK
jgi:hypothetical protein